MYSGGALRIDDTAGPRFHALVDFGFACGMIWKHKDDAILLDNQQDLDGHNNSRDIQNVILTLILFVNVHTYGGQPPFCFQM